MIIKTLVLSMLLASSLLASIYTTPVTCKEFPPNTTTQTLTVTFAGTNITAGTTSDNCYFSLNGPILTEPFSATTINYTSPADTVCWQTGGFCIFGSQLKTLSITPTPTGTEFKIVASSITTTFTLDRTTSAEVPEAVAWKLMVLGLCVFGILRSSW